MWQNIIYFGTKSIPHTLAVWCVHKFFFCLNPIVVRWYGLFRLTGRVMEINRKLIFFFKQSTQDIIMFSFYKNSKQFQNWYAKDNSVCRNMIPSANIIYIVLLGKTTLTKTRSYSLLCRPSFNSFKGLGSSAKPVCPFVKKAFLPQNGWHLSAIIFIRNPWNSEEEEKKKKIIPNDEQKIYLKVSCYKN